MLVLGVCDVIPKHARYIALFFAWIVIVSLWVMSVVFFLSAYQYERPEPVSKQSKGFSGHYLPTEQPEYKPIYYNDDWMDSP